MNLPAEVVRFFLNYNQSTGIFTWKVYCGGTSYPGRLAGCKSRDSRGYLCINLFGKKYRAHRLAVLWMSGFWPAVLVDHRNGNRSDNRWENLRPADHSENMMNCRTRKDSTHGKGVTFIKRHRKFGASICSRGKSVWLGTFNTKEEATAAYKKASEKIHGDFARKGCQ